MITKIYAQNPSERELSCVVSVLEHDGVVIYPTDGVYAFGCSLRSPKALERLRRERRLGEVRLDAERGLPPVEEPSAEETARIPEEVLMRFVNELPDGYRTVFNLYCIEEYSHRDIARMLGINEKSSSSQLFRARAMLARRIRAYLETH